LHTKPLDTLLSDNELADAMHILQKCVHCGFCLSTCPTYQILGDEANSPRGRIYTIKSLLEGEQIDDSSLDKCLLCKSCETTCPSSVEYGKLLEISKTITNNRKNFIHRTQKYLLRKILTTPMLVNIFAKKTPKITQSHYTKSVILHTGCVQKPLAPTINTAAVQVLNTLGFQVIETTQKECCGAIDLHNNGVQDGIIRVKKNIDNWLQLLQHSECIISTASGCGATIKEYQHILKNDEKYLKKSQIIAEKTLDISEFLQDKDLSVFTPQDIKISYQEPCSLQHGQQLAGHTQNILKRIGYTVPIIENNHICCGSAGTYSVFQPSIANILRTQKLHHLGKCDVIITSNIGCLLHLQKKSKIPVKHWIELLV
jgi:glycolate oxidase iron-sulfur subunit